MFHRPNRVAIVRGGGAFKDEEYDSWIDIVKRALENATTPGDKQGDEPKHLAVVEVVQSWEEAEEKAGRNEIDILMFVSVSMVDIARGFRQRHKGLTVYVMVGREVDDEPYIVPKSILGAETLREMAHKH
ncbi:MAG: hypothetical protein WC516_01025 [Patescibacteria group bacterium]